jgi:hypothetical protein
MEFNNQNGTPVQNASAKEASSKPAQTSEIAKGNSKSETEKQKPLTKETKLEPVKAEDSKPGQVQAETPHLQEATMPAKPAQDLEGTLKVVADLHRRSVQRINLISRIRQLESFEVVLTQEHDELEENPYQGCKLIIEDDKQRRFITSTPGLIRLVSQFIFNACNEKLADIEASIMFPKA